MCEVHLEYIAAGGNRHPAAADWKPGILAFGSGNNIALWNPEDSDQEGIFTLLAGHTDVVNAVKIFDGSAGRFIISGSADKTIRTWAASSQSRSFEQVQVLEDHASSVNVVAVLPESNVFASGSADGIVKLWNYSESTAKLAQSVSVKPRYLPLTCALTQLPGGEIVLAVGGTSTTIQLYVRPNMAAQFELQATLTGHEGWIRCLDFAKEGIDSNDILLASGSQDKYIRIWRLHRNIDADEGASNHKSNGPAIAVTLSNKAHQVGEVGDKHDVTFEALLVGHEDWIYTVRWAPHGCTSGASTLLSASADSSMAMWQVDEASGIWVCQTRLGEISSQKGSTTATGSTGGFWIGLWQPDGQGVVNLGRTGSWRRWIRDSNHDLWLQRPGVSGHTQELRSLAWAQDGSYLLSTGSDQTTRLFGEWKRGKHSWHELSRPQIHGYDLNCIDSISANQFISGADEKLLRVFNKPGAVDVIISELKGAKRSTHTELPETASVPVLGLSNKLVAAETNGNTVDIGIQEGHDNQEVIYEASVTGKSGLQFDQPPLEEQLARHTLWPEHEKLYGHGYEISAVAASFDGSLVATACKASSIDHAVIRLYETSEWREVKPPLTAHTLTINSLKFSLDDRFLLSVGRDRNISIFIRGKADPNSYELITSNPKGHSRMILDCSWAVGVDEPVFATAGRDKAVKIWKLVGEKMECLHSIVATTATTAVAFSDRRHDNQIRLAYGTEDGSIHIMDLAPNNLEITSDFTIDQRLVPSKAVSALRWRHIRALEPLCNESSNIKPSQLAVASDDYSLRIFNVGP